MKTITKNLFSVMLLTASLASINAIAAPKLIYKDMADNQMLAPSLIPAAITTIIKDMESKQPDLYEVVVHKADGYYVLYALSGKVWGLTRTRVDLDSWGKVTRITENYQGTEKKHYKWESEPTCPDTSVQFVAMSAYPGVGGVNEAIQMVSDAAKEKYKTMTILTGNADRQTYLNWMACPNLKGFYSIGHGSNSGIMVGKGEFIEYYDLGAKKFTNNFQNTFVVMNACEVFNYPFGTELMFGNALFESDYTENPGPNSYEYMGGHTDLLMVSSELSSACVMSKAISGEKIDFTHLKACIGKENMHFQDFGLSHPGRFMS